MHHVVEREQPFVENILQQQIETSETHCLSLIPAKQLVLKAGRDTQLLYGNSPHVCFRCCRGDDQMVLKASSWRQSIHSRSFPSVFLQAVRGPFSQHGAPCYAKPVDGTNDPPSWPVKCQQLSVHWKGCLNVDAILYTHQCMFSV